MSVELKMDLISTSKTMVTFQILMFTYVFPPGVVETLVIINAILLGQTFWSSVIRGIEKTIWT